MENLVQRQDILEFECSIGYSLSNEYINFIFNNEVDVVKNKTFPRNNVLIRKR